MFAGGLGGREGITIRHQRLAADNLLCLVSELYYGHSDYVSLHDAMKSTRDEKRKEELKGDLEKRDAATSARDKQDEADDREFAEQELADESRRRGEQVVSAMRAAPTDLHVQVNGCDALISGLWWRARAPADAGAIEVATAALGRFPASGWLQSCQRIVDRARGYCDGSGGIMHIDPDSCAWHLGGTVSGEPTQVHRCERDERHKDVGLSDDPTCHGACFGCAAAQVVVAMEAAPTESAVQLNGCRTLGSNRTSAGRADAVGAGGVALATAALARFPADDDVQESCHHALLILGPCASADCAHGTCSQVDLCSGDTVMPSLCDGHLDMGKKWSGDELWSGVYALDDVRTCECDSLFWTNSGQSNRLPCDTHSAAFYAITVPAVLVAGICTAIGRNLMKQRRTKPKWLSGNANLLPGGSTPNPAAVASAPLCFNCGELGHAARDCPN
eukprot:COSAG06_NODE_10879_length_1603_cov_0.962766_1_plen_447_part_00